MKVSLVRLGFADVLARVKEAEAHSNNLFLVSTSVMALFTLNWLQIVQPKRFKPLSGAKFLLSALSTPTVGKGYDGLVDVGYDKHFRINNSKHFAEKSIHINGIEAFWSFTKRRLAKFNGVKRNFELHLKECEWRYNRTLPQLITGLNLLVSKNKELMV